MRPRVEAAQSSTNLAKFLDNILDQLLHVVVVSNIKLECLALDSVLLGQFLRVLLASFRTGCVGYCKVGSHLSTATSCFNAHTLGTGSTCDHDHFALEAEEIEEMLGFGDFDRHVDGDVVR